MVSSNIFKFIYIKQFNLVCMEFVVNKSNTNAELFTLPSEYTPNQFIVGAGYAGNEGSIQITIRPDGKVTCYPISTLSARACMTYML